MLRLLTISAPLCLVLGCGVRAPITQFQQSTTVEVTPEAVELQVEFEISNTNDKPLKLTSYRYTVQSDGSNVYLGKAAAEQTVPRWSSVRGSIPVVIRVDDFPGDNQIFWQLSGSLGYIPPTALAETLMKSGLWHPSTPVYAYGEVSIRDEILLTE
jgi:hypothetical protein